eukprot:TRINITY_DN5650_c0_g4_i1.p1 TRINITY_DN5650_c0_g4~~TRINITY_DN5650_c0_g4_i1.p1  ORF type:complete len:195 (-),score=55.13 TRINITY_DN5650_c0_g4_i1:11-595(-)
MGGAPRKQKSPGIGIKYVEKGPYDEIFKVVIIGDAGVGKTSLLLRLVKNTFKEDKTVTLQEEVHNYQLKFSEGPILTMAIWDSGGLERWRTIGAGYYHRATGVIVAYDVTNLDSFVNAQKWFQQVERYCEESCQVLVGTKCDLVNERKVSSQEAEQFASHKNIKFIETSAKDITNVEEAFSVLGSLIQSKIETK